MEMWTRLCRRKYSSYIQRGTDSIDSSVRLGRTKEKVEGRYVQETERRVEEEIDGILKE
jgi:hypothetical protein